MSAHGLCSQPWTGGGQRPQEAEGQLRWASSPLSRARRARGLSVLPSAQTASQAGEALGVCKCPFYPVCVCKRHFHPEPGYTQCSKLALALGHSEPCQGPRPTAVRDAAAPSDRDQECDRSKCPQGALTAPGRSLGPRCPLPPSTCKSWVWLPFDCWHKVTICSGKKF